MSKTKSIIILAITIIFCSININAETTWTVTKSTNSNDGVCNADCSLREAVAVAGFDDTIVFNSNLIGQTFTLGGDDIVIDKRLTIDGNLDGVNVAFISGSNTSRHFLIQPFGDLRLKNMILVQGNGNGSGISNSGGSIEVRNSGVLFLDRVAIRGNSSGGSGGAISFSGNSAFNPIIVNSSITGNTARSAPAIYNGAILHISNTTIRGNRVINPDANGWGAIANFGSLYLRNCTVVENQAKNGGGIVAFGGFNPNIGDNNYTNLGNTIVGQNTATDSGQDILFFADLVSVGGNLIGNTNTIPGGIFNKTKDAVNLNPLVAPINSGQGGHPIDTHPLQAGSPAINNGVNSLAVEHTFGTPLTNDARGTGFPRIVGGTVDKGSFEDQSNGATLIVSKLTNSNDNVCDTDCSLREAVYAAGQDPGTDTITFALNVFGTMTVGSEIAIDNQNVNITGYPTLNSDTLIVSGSNTSRVFRLNNANVTMTGFTIANGNGAGQSEPFGGGGLLAFGGSLTLNQMIVRNNSVSNSDFIRGGGISAEQVNVVRIMNSTINNNIAPQTSAVDFGSAVAYITNTTISNNTASFSEGLGAVNINGSLYMRNSTVAGNRNANSISGSGLYCGSAAVCNIGNSIFADNIAINGSDIFVRPGGNLTSLGGNLVEDTTGYNNASMSQPKDVIGVDPMLLTLSDNGGNVPTQSLMPNSPAINLGVNSSATDPFSAAALTTDARGGGYPRILNGAVDKGAVEVFSPTAAPVSISGRVTDGKRGIMRAQVEMTDQYGITRTAPTDSRGYFQFENVESGETYIFNVSAKNYIFPAQVLNITEQIEALNFVMQSSWGNNSMMREQN